MSNLNEQDLIKLVEETQQPQEKKVRKMVDDFQAGEGILPKIVGGALAVPSFLSKVDLRPKNIMEVM